MLSNSSSQLGWTVSSILGDYGHQALHNKDHLALVWEHGERTYGELRERSMRIAAALRQKGLRSGDRVASLLFNRGEIFELYFACAYAGLTFVPVGFRLTAPEIASILEDSGARIVFTEEELNPVLSAAVESLASKPDIISLQANSGGFEYERFVMAHSPIATPQATDLQMILYTSGTTGKPKGVCLRNSSIMWLAFQQAVQFKQLNSEAVMLLNAPMYNTAAMNESSIPTFLVGGTVAILPSRGWTAERFGAFIDKWKVTHALVFPSMFKLMIEHDDKFTLPLKSMKWWYTGGENCPPALIQETMRRWNHIHLAISYGSTESGLPTIIEGDDILQRPGSVGRCNPGQSVRLVDQDGNDVPVGDVGDVWTSGPAVMSNYWNAPGLDAETVKDGWLKIGDLARQDEDGWLYIVGRSKDLIISKGQNIYPAEIENTIRHFPAVLDVSVVGLPDEEYGEAVCAAVILREGQEATKQEILSFVLQRLASYKKPKHIVFLREFPIRNGTKVDKKELATICSDHIISE